MTATAEKFQVIEPGVYDIPADLYHADPVPGGSLSSSGARRLLKTCPARFKYEQDHPAPPTDAMELGTAAHREVLGVGADIEEIKAKDWRTTRAKDEAAIAREAGKVPLLTRDAERVRAMAAALREHEIAATLLNPAYGKPEQAIFWQDAPTKIWRRALLDLLPDVEPGGRMYLADYKTAQSADLEAISKAIETYGYNAQGAWYDDAVRALGLADDVAFFLVVQETVAPFLVSVVQLDQLALEAGRHDNRKAIELYARCRKTNTWPPYVEGVAPVGLPGWAENKFLKETTS
ncbi:PD-(D/E)XK nuclease-like domain-containing protein [Spirillospora sp. NPDC127200]